jgi:hypothetical protein
MAAYALRIAATLGVVLCLQNAASADLVIKFYLDDGDVWMSLSGSGSVNPAVNPPLNFDNFSEGDPFTFAGPFNLTFTNSDLNISGTRPGGGGGAYTWDILSGVLNGQGNNASDVTLNYNSTDNLPSGSTYTFAGSALTNLTLSQLRIGTYNSTAGDSSSLGGVQLVITPEPASLAMMGVGVLGLCVTGLRRRRQPVPTPDAPATLA